MSGKRHLTSGYCEAYNSMPTVEQEREQGEPKEARG